MRRWHLWYVVVSAALGYALSWLVGDEPMDALVTAADSDGADGSSSILTLAANDADIVGLTGITFRRGGTEPE